MTGPMILFAVAEGLFAIGTLLALLRGYRGLANIGLGLTGLATLGLFLS